MANLAKKRQDKEEINVTSVQDDITPVEVAGVPSLDVGQIADLIISRMEKRREAISASVDPIIAPPKPRLKKPRPPPIEEEKQPTATTTGFNWI